MAKKKTTKKSARKAGRGRSGPSRSATRDTGTEAGSSRAERAKLERLRASINEIDAELVRLLNKRAKNVVRVGQLKRGSGIPIYAPHRESEVLSRVISQSRGPLPERTIEAVYRELMSGSFALEHALRIGFLGPRGSFSHLAASKHFGQSVDFEDLHSIDGVFTEVRRGHVDYGLVPIENSIGGGIVETLDAFTEHGTGVSVYAEAQITIHHALLANCEPGQIRRIHSKPEIFAQCRTWLATQYPNAELVPAASSSAAAITAMEEFKQAEAIGAQPVAAAIGNPLAASIYGLKILFENIEDRPGNVTRFLVLSKQRARKSGDDKTSIMFNTADKPGALVAVLGVFDRAGVNLTHIDKRPSQRQNWQYTFFLDAQGHRDDPVLASAIKEATSHCRDLTVLGSYPRSSRIL
ncbi:MAG TPA: prephenate dehydratase [Phycisphaerales bacterium]|nr:prephenate dehydratase [Phycisphaerales bacterium]